MVPKVALLVVTTVSLGLGAFWFSRSAMSGSDAAGPRERTRPAAARFASLDPDAPISAIAVLPLAHFSEGDDLFARQLHDEIITRLSELTRAGRHPSGDRVGRRQTLAGRACPGACRCGARE